MRPEWLPPTWFGESETGQTAQTQSRPANPPAEREEGGGEPAALQRVAQQPGTESGTDLDRTPAQPTDGSPSRQSMPAEKPVAEATPGRRTPVPTSPTRVVRREPEPERESEPVEASEATAELERRLAEEAARRRRARTSEPEGGTPDRRVVRSGRPQEADASGDPETSVEPAAPLSEGVSEYINVWELPLSVRRNLPELNLTIHVFSPDAAERFVLINGERYTAGDSIGEARIVDIRREGAIVDFRSHRFLLQPR